MVQLMGDAIENAILSALYQAWSESDSDVNLITLCEQGGFDRGEFEKVVHRLNMKGLMSEGSFVTHEITPDGVIYTEQNAIVAEELKKEHIEARTVLLKLLYRLYEENGPLAETHYEELAVEAELDRYLALRDLLVLAGIGYLSEMAVGCFNLSNRGLQKMEEYAAHCRMAEEFERISGIEPQPRGRALQKFLAELLQQGGWSQLEGIRTSHEELDIILFKGREYYLIECKWETPPVEASVIRELFGKLENRVGIQAVVASMSGFTKGAVEQAEAYCNKRLFVLLGPEELRSLVSRRVTFEQMLDKKYGELVIQTKVLFS